MPNDTLFDGKWIKEIKYYQPPPPDVEHSVAWIKAIWDPDNQNIIDNESTIKPVSQVPPLELEEPPDAFSPDNIFKIFTVDSESFPIPTDLSAADTFSQSNIYTPFIIEEYPTPQPRTASIDYNGIFAQFQQDNYYAFAREVPFIFGLDYNGIFSYFKIRENEFPTPAGWVEPFDQNGIFSIFGISDDNKFHGFPAPRTIPSFQDTLPPKGYTITYDMISYTKKISAEDKETHQGDSFYVSPLDRDTVRGLYDIFISAYWAARENNDNEN